MTEYSCFWWECGACDADNDCSDCLYRIALNTNRLEYEELYNEYEDKIHAAIEPITEEYAKFFDFYIRGVISK